MKLASKFEPQYILTVNRADMRVETGHLLRCRPRAFGAATAFGIFALVGLAGSAWAQSMQTQTEAVPRGQLQHQQTNDPAPPPLAPPATQLGEPAPPSAFRPGFLDAFGRWIDGSISDLNAGISGARGTLDKAGDVAKGAAGAAKDAAGALAKLPVVRMVDGREKCAVAPNGSPDCYAAASVICKSKGYGEGKSVDTQSAQKCSARVWISGRSPKEGECATETYVIRAVCQ